MQIKKIILLSMIICCTCVSIHGQTNTVAQTLQEIYQNYDSLKYLSFDVKFDYGSDTLLGKYDAEQMDATYTLAGKKAIYRMGDIDFMQNDSFLIAVYNRDKLIVVDEPKAINVGSQLPMRSMLDSLLLAYGNDYTMNRYTQGSDTGVIQMDRSDSSAQFDHFRLQYDVNTKMLYSLSYEFTQQADLDTVVINSWMTSNGSSVPPSQKKRLTVRFLHYRFDNYDESLYDENKYIWFENGMCKPVTKYEDYKIYYNKPVVD